MVYKGYFIRILLYSQYLNLTFHRRIKKIHKDGKGAVTSIDAETNLQDKDFKKTAKITWLAEAQDAEASFTPTKCVHYDHIISKGSSSALLIGAATGR